MEKTPKYKEAESKYICLKLQRQLDVVELIRMLSDFVGYTKESGVETGILNTLGLSVKWLDLAEILLKADKSWDTKPYFYNKYEVQKNKESKQ